MGTRKGLMTVTVCGLLGLPIGAQQGVPADSGRDTSVQAGEADTTGAGKRDTLQKSPRRDTAAASRPAGSARGFSRNPLWSGINLSKQQATKIDSLHTRLQEVYQKDLAAVRATRDSIRQQLEAAAPDSAALNRYTRQLGEIHALISRHWVDYLLQLKAVLSPEQYKKLLEREWQRQQPLKGRLGHGRYGYFNWDALPLE